MSFLCLWCCAGKHKFCTHMPWNVNHITFLKIKNVSLHVNCKLPLPANALVPVWFCYKTASVCTSNRSAPVDMQRYLWPGYEVQLLGGLQRQQNSAQFCDTLLQTEGEKEGKLQSSLWCKTMYKMHNWVILSWLILYVKVSQSQPTAASLQLSARTCLRSFQPPPHLHLDRSVSSSSRPWRPRLCSSWLVCFTLVCWR